jgi:hypothetical protein
MVKEALPGGGGASGKSRLTIELKRKFIRPPP